jgi:hypothetical protein
MLVELEIEDLATRDKRRLTMTYVHVRTEVAAISMSGFLPGWVIRLMD